jgi:hypothetical protein
MNKPLISLNGLLGAATLMVLFAITTPVAQADDLKLEAQLIWGANTQTSPNPRHKPVEANVAKKLKSLPFKWSNYFEVNRKQFAVTQAEATRVTMSADCEITVRRVDKDLLEVVLFGKGKQVSKIKQTLPKKEMLVLAGDAPDFTAWFVMLKPVE